MFQGTFQYVDPTNAKHFSGLFSIYQYLSSWEWIFARTPKFTLRRTFKIIDDSVDLSVKVRGGTIDSIDVITTNPALANSTDVITATLIGTAFKPIELKQKLSAIDSQQPSVEYVHSLVSCFSSLLGTDNLDKKYRSSFDQS